MPLHMPARTFQRWVDHKDSNMIHDLMCWFVKNVERGKTTKGMAWFKKQVIWARSRRLYHVLASSRYYFHSVFSSKWCKLFCHIFIDRMNWNLWTTFSKNALLIGSLTNNRLQSPQLLPCSLEPGAACSSDSRTKHEEWRNHA